MARSSEKDITGFFEKAACGKAFSSFLQIRTVSPAGVVMPFLFLGANRKRYQVIQISIDSTCFLRLCSVLHINLIYRFSVQGA